MNLSVFLEEAEHYGVLTEYLLSALAQYRKKELEINLLLQNFPKDRRILQNCPVHYLYRQGHPEDAKEAAMDIGIPTLNPKEVSHYESRTVPVGYEEVEIG